MQKEDHNGTLGRVRIQDLISRGILRIGDGYRAKNSEFGASGVPFARAGNVNGGFHLDQADLIPFEALGRVGEKISQPGDVVFTSKGTVGRFSIVTDKTPRFVYAPQLCYWRTIDIEVIDPRYLYYWMHSSEFDSQIHGLKSQTDMAEYVSLSDQRRMYITLPSIQDQRTIAHILGTLDDKIELNRRMSQTLEEMARTLFASWFVNFDPVRAKAAGQQPEGMDAETAALFPSEFEASPMGKIPAGWKARTLGDIAINSRRTTSPKSVDPTTPYIGLEHMPRRSIALDTWGIALGLESNKTWFDEGDILFGKLRPYFHKVGIAPLAGLCSTDILVISSKPSQAKPSQAKPSQAKPILAIPNIKRAVCSVR